MNKIKIVNKVEDKFKVNIEEDNNDIVITINRADKMVQVKDLKPGQIFKGKTGTQYIFLEFDENGNATECEEGYRPGG